MILSRLRDTLDIRKILREACKLKNVPKSGKSPKGGWSSTQKIKNSKIQNVDCFCGHLIHIMIDIILMFLL